MREAAIVAGEALEGGARASAMVAAVMVVAGWAVAEMAVAERAVVEMESKRSREAAPGGRALAASAQPPP